MTLPTIAAPVFTPAPDNVDGVNKGGLETYPDLQSFGLTPKEIEDRRRYIGGSDANIIALGNHEAVNDLWLEKQGRAKDKRPKTLNMYMGNATEALNAAWYTSVTGDAVRWPQMIAERDYDGLPMRASLDGVCLNGDAIWEAKHVSGYDFQTKTARNIMTVATEYWAQLQHNMLTAGKERAVLSVLFDTGRHEYAQFEADPFYQDALLNSEAMFWEHVKNDTLPHVDAMKVPKPDRIIPTRHVDMTGNNAWASAAADWLAYRDMARLFDKAGAELKSLVEPDTLRAIGHGIAANRDKRGSIRITVLNADHNTTGDDGEA